MHTFHDIQIPLCWRRVAYGAHQTYWFVQRNQRLGCHCRGQTLWGYCRAAAQAIAAYEPTNNRSELKKTAHNELIIDAYNANLTSMTAALDNFAHIAAPHKMLILGEMRELGLSSASAHKQVAAQALSSGCEEVWLVGENFQPYAEGALWFPDVEAVKTAIMGGNMPTGRLILIKGSNGTRLFELLALL